MKFKDQPASGKRVTGEDAVPFPRRLPRWKEVEPLLGFSRPTWDRVGARLSRCASVGDVREFARTRVPAPVFDFVDGAAGAESSLLRSRDLFNEVEFNPRALRDVSSIDVGTSLVGERSDLPLFLCPTGFTRMMHHEGEVAVARAASNFGVPYTLSTVGTTSIETVAQFAPRSSRWFQLYLMSDRNAGERLLDRAKVAGYSSLVVTIDAPVPGRRLRDVRSGLMVPPRLTVRTIGAMARRPRWCYDVLTTEPLGLAMVDAVAEAPEAFMARTFDPSVAVDDIKWLRDAWDGALIVKGVQSVEDALAVEGVGADALILSTHGGRQLEHAPLPLELLPTVRSRVSAETEVFIDGGIMSGTDIIAALALGARGVGIGRAYLYGLMAGGQRGVERVLELLRGEMRTNLGLLGCSSVQDLTPDHVRIRGQFGGYEVG